MQLMTDEDIEISIPVVINAAVYFRMTKADWNALSDQAKRDTVAGHVVAASQSLGNDTLSLTDETSLSADIVVPDEIDLSDLEFYSHDA